LRGFDVEGLVQLLCSFNLLSRCAATCLRTQLLRKRHHTEQDKKSGWRSANWASHLEYHEETALRRAIRLRHALYAPLENQSCDYTQNRRAKVVAMDLTQDERPGSASIAQHAGAS
jgi:hypothetical protein